MGEQDKGDADGLELTFSWGKKQEKKKMHELVTDHEQCYEANKLKCDGKKPDWTMIGYGGGSFHE